MFGLRKTTREEQRSLARRLLALADEVLTAADLEPGTSDGDRLDVMLSDAYRAMARGNVRDAARGAVEILVEATQ